MFISCDVCREPIIAGESCTMIGLVREEGVDYTALRCRGCVESHGTDYRQGQFCDGELV